MAQTSARWPGSPRGSCVRFHVTSRPRFPGALGPVRRAHPALASFVDLGALLRARIRSRPSTVSRRRAAAALLGFAPPEPCSGPVLGPLITRAVTPRVRSSSTTQRVANPLRRVETRRPPALRLKHARTADSPRRSSACDADDRAASRRQSLTPTTLSPGFWPFAGSTGFLSTGPAPVSRQPLRVSETGCSPGVLASSTTSELESS